MVEEYRHSSGSNDLSKFVWAGYALQLLAPFSVGILFVVAAVIAYLKHDESIGTIEESHFRWQLRTFWIGLIASVIGVVLLLIWIGVPILMLTELWIIYRVVKGGYYYADRRPIDNNGIF
jgi:uncharacterized membrane protein